NVAQRLRRHPVLAVPAMQIAAEHPEAERFSAGQDVVERLLLDGVAARRIDVAVGRVQPAIAVVANLAHAGETRGNRAAMAAGEALDAAAVERAVQLCLARLLGELFGQRLHTN